MSAQEDVKVLGVVTFKFPPFSLGESGANIYMWQNSWINNKT